jgi:hypothetical protein
VRVYDFVGAAPAARAVSRRDRPAPQRGLRSWQAIALLVVIAAGCGLLDYARGLSSGGVFGLGIVVGSLLAILLVRRSGMFPIVIAPPIVYVAGKLTAAILRHQNITSRTGLVDVATNWFVFGFSAMAGATAIVLVIAGIRLLINR